MRRLRLLILIGANWSEYVAKSNTNLLCIALAIGMDAILWYVSVLIAAVAVASEAQGICIQSFKEEGNKKQSVQVEFTQSIFGTQTNANHDQIAVKWYSNK